MIGGPDRKASDGSPLVLIQGPRGLVAMKRAEVASMMKEKKMLERELNKVTYFVKFRQSWFAVMILQRGLLDSVVLIFFQ